MERINEDLQDDLRRQSALAEKLRADIQRSKEATSVAEDDRWKGQDEVRWAARKGRCQRPAH